jgi:hypothetical protein
MKFEDLLALVGDEPLFEPDQLQPGSTAPAQLQRELTRWVKSGRLHELRRGLYALAPPFQKTSPHPFLVANRIVPGSYVSLQSALAHYGLIPDHVAVTTSVTAGPPGTWDTPIGRYDFRHIRPDLLTGSQRTVVGGGQEARLATREKALLDLIHLELGAREPRSPPSPAPPASGPPGPRRAPPPGRGDGSRGSDGRAPGGPSRRVDRTTGADPDRGVRAVLSSLKILDYVEGHRHRAVVVQG